MTQFWQGTVFLVHGGNHLSRGYQWYIINIQGNGLILTGHFKNYLMQRYEHLKWCKKSLV